jgi:hypothetical protein
VVQVPNENRMVHGPLSTDERPTSGTNPTLQGNRPVVGASCSPVLAEGNVAPVASTPNTPKEDSRIIFEDGVGRTMALPFWLVKTWKVRPSFLPKVLLPLTNRHLYAEYECHPQTKLSIR